GVITCGAGYTGDSKIFSNDKARSYIGIAGNEDFNYAEVKNAVLYLQKSKYDAEFIPFQGGHTWPLSDPVNKALRLLTLKAFTRGYLNNGALEVDEFYKKD